MALLSPSTDSPPEHTTLPHVATELPAIPATVHLGLTVGFTVIFSLLFILIYIQLFFILRYGHKRLSFQSVFLFLCLIWASLRITLFSFYFRNCQLANTLPTFFYWLLYCLPVCLQFITLTLLAFYFGKAYIKGRRNVINSMRISPNHRHRTLVVSFMIMTSAFVSVNIVCAILIRKVTATGRSPPHLLLLVRVMIDGLLFVVMAIILCYFLIQMKRAGISSKLQVDENQEMSMLQAVICSGIIVALYVSRAIYNIIAISPTKVPTFGYGWINVTDQADLYAAHGYGYISFVCVLLAWEVLPTFIVVWLFRVKKPYNKNLVINSAYENHYNTFNYDQQAFLDDDDYPINPSVQYARYQSYFTDVPSSHGRENNEYDQYATSTISSKFCEPGSQS
ncbi:Integral membrane protein GPR137B [Trichoplax sp. H2]|nr:Integral membrane protein GPR137B [Trichoplax sp. H2]|eukprot:RDD40864.1 Integral membrane protein GPR137B [Trichoplax sp. H2]